MKKIFTPEMKKVLFESVLVALLVFLSQNFLLKLWAPSTAAETLKQENYINSKKETYYEAINLMTRSFAMITFDSVKMKPNYVRTRGATYPSEFELNSCLSKLYLYTDNKDIIDSYKKIVSFKTGELVDTLIFYQVKFLSNIKNDLSGGKLTISNYEYIVTTIDTTYK
jgi:hypothetical protein